VIDVDSIKREVICKVKSKGSQKIKKGYPLIQKDNLVNPNSLQEEGTILKLVDEQGKFIGKGYFGKQNKGYGWILTRNEKQAINQVFFEEKVKKALKERAAFFNSEDTTAFRVFNGEGIV